DGAGEPTASEMPATFQKRNVHDFEAEESSKLNKFQQPAACKSSGVKRYPTWASRGRFLRQRTRSRNSNRFCRSRSEVRIHLKQATCSFHCDAMDRKPTFNELFRRITSARLEFWFLILHSMAPRFRGRAQAQEMVARRCRQN